MESRGFSIKKVSGVVEPVTLGAYKAHLEIDFDKHDTLLTEFLVSARIEIENFLCVSLIETTITARWEELGSEELPYGPVHSIETVKDKDGEDVTGHTIEGMEGSFMSIKADRTEPTVIVYKAGYQPPIPHPIKLAIMKRATDHFEQRTGFDLSGNVGAQPLPNDWKSVCRPYRRITWAA